MNINIFQIIGVIVGALIIVPLIIIYKAPNRKKLKDIILRAKNSGWNSPEKNTLLSSEELQRRFPAMSEELDRLRPRWMYQHRSLGEKNFHSRNWLLLLTQGPTLSKGTGTSMVAQFLLQVVCTMPPDESKTPALQAALMSMTDSWSKLAQQKDESFEYLQKNDFVSLQVIFSARTKNLEKQISRYFRNIERTIMMLPDLNHVPQSIP